VTNAAPTAAHGPRLALALMVAVTALWGAVVLYCGYLTLRPGGSGLAGPLPADGLSVRALRVVLAFLAVQAAVPTVLWLGASVACRRSDRSGPPLAAGVAALVAVDSAVFAYCTPEVARLPWVVGFLAAANALGVAAAATAWRTRPPARSAVR